MSTLPIPEDVRVIRDAIAHVDGLNCNADGMLTYKSAEKVARASLSAYPACVPAEHTAAARVGALNEAAQVLYARWRSAWDEWSKLVPRHEGEQPSELCRRAWARMEQALDSYEAVSALVDGETGQVVP